VCTNVARGAGERHVPGPRARTCYNPAFSARATMTGHPGGKDERRGAPRAGVIAAFLALYLIWGSTYLAIRIAVVTLPPFLMGGARFVAAGVLLFAFARLRGAPRATTVQWRSASIVGACLLLGGNGGLVWALKTIPSGVGSLLVATTSLWMVLLDWLRPRGTRPPARVLVGLAVGFVGLFIFVGPGSIGEDGLEPVAVGAVIFATLCWGVGSIYSRHAPLPASSLLATSMEMLVGGGLLAVAGAALGEWKDFSLHAVTPASAIAWTYLLVVGSLVGFTAYIWLLKVSTPARVSTYAYVNPVVAVFLGHVFAGETLTVRMLAGAAVILAAVAAITTAPASHAPAEAEGPPGFVEVAPALEPIPAPEIPPADIPAPVPGGESPPPGGQDHRLPRLEGAGAEEDPDPAARGSART